MDTTNHVERLGAFLGEQKLSLAETLEAVLFVAGDALAQATDGSFDADILAAGTRDLTAAYRINCGLTPDVGAVQSVITH